MIFANCGLALDPVPTKCSVHVCVPVPLLSVTTGKYNTLLFKATSKTFRQFVNATESISDGDVKPVPDVLKTES